MTRTSESMVIKAMYKYDAELKDMRICFKHCDITELEEVHIYKRVAKRAVNELHDSSKNYEVNVDDILTTVIITDFDFNCDSEDYKESYREQIDLDCLDLDYDTLDCTFIQLA